MTFPPGGSGGGGGGGITIPITLTSSGASFNLGSSVVSAITAQLLPALQQIVNRSNAASQAVKNVGSAAQSSVSGMTNLRNAMIGFSAVGVGAVYTVGAIIRRLMDLASIASGIALRGLTVLAAGFSIIKKTVLDTTESFTRFRIQLEGITKSTQRAGDIANFVQEFAQQTPFATSEIEQIVKVLGQLSQTSATLNRANFSDTKKELTDLINTIQGLALLNPYGVEGALIAFRNAVGGQLRSLELRLDIPAKAIAQSIGKSVDELKKGGPVVIEALKAYVDSILGADIIQRLGDQLSVQLGNISDSFQIIGRRIGESGFYKEVVGFFTEISDALADFTLSAEGQLSKFERLGLTKRISDALTVSFRSVTQSFQAAGAGIFGLAGEDPAEIYNASPIEAFARVVTTSLELIAVGLSKGAEEVTKFFTAVDATSGTTPFQSFVSEITAKFKSFGEVIGEFTDIFKLVISALDKALPLLEIAIDIIGNIARLTLSLGSSIGEGISRASAANTGIGAFSGFFSGFFDEFTKTGKSAVLDVAESLKENLSEFTDRSAGKPIGSTRLEFRISSLENERAQLLREGQSSQASYQVNASGSLRDIFLATGKIGDEARAILYGNNPPVAPERLSAVESEILKAREELRILQSGSKFSGPPLAGLVDSATTTVEQNKDRLEVFFKNIDSCSTAVQSVTESVNFQRNALKESADALSGFSSISDAAAQSIEESTGVRGVLKILEAQLPDPQNARQLADDAIEKAVKEATFQASVAGTSPEQQQAIFKKLFDVSTQLEAFVSIIDNLPNKQRELGIRAAGDLLGQSRTTNKIATDLILGVSGKGQTLGDVFGDKDIAGKTQTFFDTRLEATGALPEVMERLNDSSGSLSDRLRASQEASNIYNTALQETAKSLGITGNVQEVYAAEIQDVSGLDEVRIRNLASLGEILKKVKDAEIDRMKVLRELTSLEAVGRRLGVPDQGSIQAQIEQFKFDFAAVQANPNQFNLLEIERSSIPELERLRSLSFDPETRRQLDELIELADTGFGITMPGALEILEFTQTLVSEFGAALEQTLGDAIFRALKDDKMTLEEFGNAIGDAVLRSISDGVAGLIVRPLTDELGKALEKTILGGLFDSTIGVQPITATTATIDARTVTVTGPVAGGGAVGTVPAATTGAVPATAGAPAPTVIATPSQSSSAAAAQSSAGAPLVVATGTGQGAVMAAQQIPNSPVNPNAITVDSAVGSAGVSQGAPTYIAAGTQPAGATGLDAALPYIGAGLGTINGIRGLTQEGGTEGARGVGNLISALALPLAFTPLGATGGLLAAILGGTIASFGEGGEVDKPTLAIVGEKGPEMIVPKRGGMSPKTAAMLAGTRRRRGSGPQYDEDDQYDDEQKGGQSDRGVTIINMIEPDRVTRQALENDPNIVVNPVMENIQKRGAIYRSIRDHRR